MEIRFFLTGDDDRKFQKYNSSRPRRRLQLILACLFCAYWGYMAGLELNTTAIITLVIPLMGIVLLASAWFLWQIRRKFALYLAKEGEHIITITPESFRERTLISDTVCSWKAFRTITADKYNLYFFLDFPLARAYVIPRRAFASPEDADTFLGWAKSYWAHGHGMQQPGSPGSATGYERWG